MTPESVANTRVFLTHTNVLAVCSTITTNTQQAFYQPMPKSETQNQLSNFIHVETFN